MSQSVPQKIIVGMPAYNEEKYIGSIILQAQRHAGEVIVVDDGSTDNTVRISQLAGATVIKHLDNKGYGATIQDILAHAKKRNPDVLIILDADSQHDPEEIPVLVEAVSRGFDLVIGSRKILRDKIPAYRKIGQKVISYLTRSLSGEKLSDTESGFRAYSSRALDVLEPKEKGMAVSAEIISEATKKGLRIAEVPVSIIYTGDGSTLNPLIHGLGVFHRILVMISERKPLLFFGAFGCISLILGVVTGIIVVQILQDNQYLSTGTALLSMLFITVGMLSIFTGVILDVLVNRLRDIH